MKIKWKAMTARDRAMLIVRGAFSVVIIVLTSLQLGGVMENAIDYTVPLLGLYFLIVSTQEWKQHRGLAVLSICTALFLFIVTCIVWFG